MDVRGYGVDVRGCGVDGRGYGVDVRGFLSTLPGSIAPWDDPQDKNVSGVVGDSWFVIL